MRNETRSWTGVGPQAYQWIRRGLKPGNERCSKHFGAAVDNNCNIRVTDRRHNLLTVSSCNFIVTQWLTSDRGMVRHFRYKQSFCKGG